MSDESNNKEPKEAPEDGKGKPRTPPQYAPISGNLLPRSKHKRNKEINK